MKPVVALVKGEDPEKSTKEAMEYLGGMEAIVPRDLAYDHSEGNSPAHIKSSLVGNSVSVFVENGQLVLCTWQRIYFCEFDGPRSRKVLVKVVEG